jgi:hypothetical protein
VTTLPKPDLAHPAALGRTFNIFLVLLSSLYLAQPQASPPHAPRQRNAVVAFTFCLSRSLAALLLAAPQTRSHPLRPHGLTASAHAIARHHLARQLRAGTKERRERSSKTRRRLALRARLQRKGAVVGAQRSFQLPHAAPAWIIDRPNPWRALPLFCHAPDHISTPPDVSFVTNHQNHHSGPSSRGAYSTCSYSAPPSLVSTPPALKPTAHAPLRRSTRRQLHQPQSFTRHRRLLSPQILPTCTSTAPKSPPN